MHRLGEQTCVCVYILIDKKSGVKSSEIKTDDLKHSMDQFVNVAAVVYTEN